MSEWFLDGKVTLHCGDSRQLLTMLANDSFDSCVTDPPYHLVSIVKRFGKPDSAPVRLNGVDIDASNDLKAAYARQSAGFMGKQWDGGDIAFDPGIWREIYRVLKPGAHLLAMGGTRTYHRMACAIEDAGFEIRDTIMWLYGSGFPKSHDVSKGIDRAAGAEREIVGSYVVPGYAKANVKHGTQRRTKYQFDKTSNEAATDIAHKWEGWGTALKPACELIVLARKPLSEKTVAANVLKWGTGALNIDGCRVEGAPEPTRFDPTKHSHEGWRMNATGAECYARAMGREGEASAERRYTDEGSTNFAATPGPRGGSPMGRWPANIIHDGSEEVVAAFPESDGAQGIVSGREPSEAFYGRVGRVASLPPRNDSGSAARFFYTSKADSDDRIGSKHPTVKPLDLMQYLVRLITPKATFALVCETCNKASHGAEDLQENLSDMPEGISDRAQACPHCGSQLTRIKQPGVVLDCFAGTGTTGEAAFREGMSAVLIEREEEYCADVRRRMGLVLAGPEERARESIKARGLLDTNAGPLFDWKPE
jgi:site-specific DNA-methyltransferase (adenine-specific)